MLPLSATFKFIRKYGIFKKQMRRLVNSKPFNYDSINVVSYVQGQSSM